MSVLNPVVRNSLEAISNLLYLVRASATDPAAIEYLDLADDQLKIVVAELTGGHFECRFIPRQGT